MEADEETVAKGVEDETDEGAADNAGHGADGVGIISI